MGKEEELQMMENGLQAVLRYLPVPVRSAVQ